MQRMLFYEYSFDVVGRGFDKGSDKNESGCGKNTLAKWKKSGAGGQNRTGYARLFRAALYH